MGAADEGPDAALALLSGGLDSTVAAALWAAEHGSLAEGLFVDYGQRAAARERDAARAVGKALGIELRVVTLPLLGELGGNALVDDEAALPHPDPERLDETAERTADAVWVPNRNGVLVNLAAAVAEARGLDVVVVGFNAEEGASFPDNSSQYLARIDACISLGTRGRVGVRSPTIDLDKAGLLAAGRRVGAPVELTWSCYEGGEAPCGACESCRRRQRAEAATGA